MIFLLAAAILASEPTSAPYDVVRAGDRAMACPQLIAEIKTVVRDNGSSLRAALADLRTASRSFKELSREVRQKPSRLLFSGEARDRKLP